MIPRIKQYCKAGDYGDGSTPSGRVWCGRCNIYHWAGDKCPKSRAFRKIVVLS